MEPLQRTRPSSVELNDTVIAGGFCIGCGACASARDPFEIEETEQGFLQARLSARDEDPGVDYLKRCPMSGAGDDETSIAKSLFGADCDYAEGVGYWRGLYAGHLADQDDRRKGSSGGLVTWMARELLARGRVDHIVHVQSADRGEDGQLLYHYGISSSVDALERGRGSAYYPVTMATVIDAIRATPGRYAIVTVPCFAKAIRLLTKSDAVLAERVSFVIGIVCGHLKGRFFGEYMGWTVGVRPAALEAIKFRRKIPGSPASRYGVVAQDRTPHAGNPVDLYFGTSWELGFMKYKSCDYCDDVFAETADIVFGDAWLGRYVADWRGHNIVVTRSAELHAILLDAAAAATIHLDPISVKDAITTQSSGLRHRREGLAVRLAWMDEHRRWRPQKRIAADAAITDPHRRGTYLKRAVLSELSVTHFRTARNAGRLTLFYALMSGPVFRYYLYQHGPWRAVKETIAVKWIRRTIFSVRNTLKRLRGRAPA